MTTAYNFPDLNISPISIHEDEDSGDVAEADENSVNTLPVGQYRSYCFYELFKPLTIKTSSVFDLHYIL